MLLVTYKKICDVCSDEKVETANYPSAVRVIAVPSRRQTCDMDMCFTCEEAFRPLLLQWRKKQRQITEASND